MYVRVKPRPHTHTIWTEVSSSVPHFLQMGLLLSKSPVYEPLPHIPGSPQMERGPYRERCPYPETFLTYLTGSLVKELPPEAASTEPLQRERHFIHRAPFIHLSKSLVDEPSFRFPKWGPYGKRCLSPEPSLHILQGPQLGSTPSRFPSHTSHRDAPPLEPW